MAASLPDIRGNSTIALPELLGRWRKRDRAQVRVARRQWREPQSEFASPLTSASMFESNSSTFPRSLSEPTAKLSKPMSYSRMPRWPTTLISPPLIPLAGNDVALGTAWLLG